MNHRSPAQPTTVRLRTGRRAQSLSQDCAQALAVAIRDRSFPPGSRLPSETELAAQLDVSRATLREALRTLEDQRLIVRRHGLGTFVAESVVEIEKDLRRNIGVTAMIRAAGYQPRTITQAKQVIVAPDDVAGRLDLPAESQVVRWERLRLADDSPVVLSVEIVSRDLIDDDELAALDDSDQGLSLLRALSERRGVVVQRASADLVPVSATERLAALLDVEPGDPLLCIKQVDFDADGRPVVYSVGYHVANWVRFTVERVGPGEMFDD